MGSDNVAMEIGFFLSIVLICKASSTSDREDLKL